MQTSNDFLKMRQYFNLGDLPTESPHPETRELSTLAQTDLPKAIDLLFHVDVLAWKQFKNSLGVLEKLQVAIEETLKKGHKIYLCGCGATGRLSINLELIWRKQHPQNDQLISFMAGGDVAFVSAIEGFEDFPEYGVRQLNELGFQQGDLLISSSEGGETPFVIGATLEAARISNNKPWFLYCNPKELLIEKVERSQQILTHPRIENMCIYVGPMALTGSTRMQASSVLMMAIGLCLFEKKERWSSLVDDMIEFESQNHSASLQPLIESEANIYKSGHHTIYQSMDYAATVFTDTTERAPTFSLTAFDHPLTPMPEKSLSYVCIPSTTDSAQAWNILIGRAPRPLQWPEVNTRTTSDFLLGFDFSRKAIGFRNQIIPDKQHYLFNVINDKKNIRMMLTHKEFKIPLHESLLINHLYLKTVLNIHSTLVMGLLGRYQGNLMTYVKPTNGKLIDRSARYIEILLKQKGIDISYEKIIEALFEAIPHIKSNEAIVLKVYNQYISTLSFSLNPEPE